MLKEFWEIFALKSVSCQVLLFKKLSQKGWGGDEIDDRLIELSINLLGELD